VTTVPTTDINALVAAIYGDDHHLMRQQLADRLGVSLDVIKAAVKAGLLVELYVSERRRVITPEGAAAYLRRLNSGAA
jgi:hypothetical protein